MKKSLEVKIFLSVLFLALFSAVSLLPFIKHSEARSLSQDHESPRIQNDEGIGPPPVPDTPRAPEPGEMYDPALSPDSVIDEPDPLFDKTGPAAEQPEPYVEEAQPVVEEP